MLHHKGERSSVVRKVIAERIIALAKSGERDPDKLCELAMDALAVNVRHSVGLGEWSHPAWMERNCSSARWRKHG